MRSVLNLLLAAALAAAFVGCASTPPPPDQVAGAGDARGQQIDQEKSDIRAKQREAQENAPPLQPSGN
ncbi:MAG: hypothetical protein SNJ74_01295 [Fimbriimonadaceae bacterium]